MEIKIVQERSQAEDFSNLLLGRAKNEVLGIGPAIEGSDTPISSRPGEVTDAEKRVTQQAAVRNPKNLSTLF